MKRPLNVLLVEDNLADAELLLRALRNSGFDPVWRRVDSEAAFLEQLNAGADLVLSDYAMPQFSGLRALELLDRSGLEIPFILVSGTIGEEVAVAVMKLGAADYLLKDRLTRLGSAVEQALNQWRLRRERLQAVAALHESERFARAALNGLTAHIAILDEAGKVLAVNEAWRAFATRNGAASDRVGEGVNYLAVCDRVQDADARTSRSVAGAIREVLAGRRTRFESEYACHSPDEQRWFMVRVTPFPDEGARRVVVAHEDITDRKQAELELRRREEHFRRLIEHASDLITVVNGQGIIRFQSPSSERILGYRPEEMVRRNALELVHQDDVPRVQAAIQQALADSTRPVAAEFRICHRDGSWRIMQSVGRSVPGEAADGFIIVNSRDVTESRTLEESFRQAQKMEGIGQLAGGVAHDFNNILAVIQLQAEMLEVGGELNPTQREFAAEIGKAAQRAANLTRQLLLFSRRQTMQPRDFDLNEAVTNVTKMLRRMLGEDVEMQFRLSAQPLFIHGDAGMLDQVLMNLVINARDAMPAGGSLFIETAARVLDEAMAARLPQARAGHFACLSVSDSGAGIAPEILPRIFEPFFTTKDVGKGTGLGLPTVLGIVQQHQGWIEVQSELGRGTTFLIYLPRLLRAAAAGMAVPELAAMPRGSETILLVEDDPALGAIMQKVLVRLGYRVIGAANGAAAVAAWKQQPGEIDLLLTDLVMPDGMSGRDLARHLLQVNPRLKVIFMSGYSPEVAAKDFPFVEGVNFLAKPCEAHRLAQTVRECLDKA
jgi:PAS domain S-box-containing protein